MKATEQLSAMEMMAVDPIVARGRAALLGRGDLDAAAGGDLQRYGRVRRLLVGVVLIGVDDGAFWSQMQAAVDLREDVLNGVIKSVVFGIAVTLIALFEGYDAPPTAEGVSRRHHAHGGDLLAGGARRSISCSPHSCCRGAGDGTQDDRSLGRACSSRGGLAALLVLALKVGNARTTSARRNGYSVYRRIRQHRRPQAARAGQKLRRGGRPGGRIGFDNQKFQARVTLRIDKRYKFPKDTLGVDPDLGPARRAVRRASRAGATRRRWPRTETRSSSRSRRWCWSS